MKKKLIPALVIAIIAIVVIAAVAVTRRSGGQSFVNPSRRDGKITVSEDPGDDQLHMVSGDELTPARDDLPNESTQDNTAAKEIAWKIDPDDISVISEALTVSDGNKEAFFDNEEFQDITPIDSEYLSLDSDLIPSKYDARSDQGRCYVTKVEDQGYSYLCWAYAALSAVESDILKTHSDYSPKSLNLSEKHLAYYNVHQSEGSLGGYIDSDYRELVNPDNEENAWIFDYDTGYVAVGGVADYCISLLTAWKGPVYERGADAFKDIYGSKAIFRDNKEKPSEAFRSDFHVQGVSQVRGDITNNELIKRMILKHGAVTAGVNSDEKFWKNRHSSLYSFFEDKKVPTADHEITIIGWDDDYSATNFSASPFGNGAWLCKNSWGTKAGDKGYFYLSYYDDTLEIDSVSAYSVSCPGDEDYYDNNYQVAGFLTNVESALKDSLNSVFAYNNSDAPYAVLYEAKDDEILKAIGFMSLDCYGQYEIQIYKNVDVTDALIDLAKLKDPDHSQKVSAITAGYHTYPLTGDKENEKSDTEDIQEETGIELCKGDNFLVVIKPDHGERLVFEAAADNVSGKNYDEWNNLTGSFDNNYSASGLSFYPSKEGTALESQQDKDFFIKAYTVNNISTQEAD